ncbi:LCP family protein [uncultured Aurantimicrobium sp.]|uniref:LCP family protein n=1 Tax=uncultured Aurantimicrobium sp. TaxID=1705357 RepID=UPI002621F300|nr:LCP family protein [uncultured Aurantimicrobium sp.]
MSEEKASRQRRIRSARAAIRHGRVAPVKGSRTVLGFIAAGLSVVLVATLSIAGIAFWDITRSANAGVALANDQKIPDIGAIEGGVNFLLVGSDSREGTDANVFDADPGSTLNDVNILLHISADHTNATVVSIPRDLVVHYPECPDADGDGYSGGGWTGPINGSLNEGGLPCVVLTVEELTGLSIPFAAMIQFNGVIEMANAVGGVEVCVAEPIEDEYTQTFLDAGMHTLSGLQALQFLRTRHGVGDGSDLGRISNQQVFLSSLVRKLKSAQTLTNPVALFGLAKAAISNMTLSNSLNSLDTMVSIAMALKDIPLENIVFVQYPGSTGGEGVYSGKVQPNQAEADALFAAILADQPVGLSGTTGNGSVADPEAEAKAAAAAEAAAKAAAKAAKASPSPSASSSSSATAAPSAAATTPAPEVAVLPDTVNGQTAGQYTCSAGRTLDQQ